MHFSNPTLSNQGQTGAIKHIAELSALVKLPYSPRQRRTDKIKCYFPFFKKVGNHISNIEH